MKKCPRCELNYIKNNYDEICELCKENEQNSQSKGNNDENKKMVEQDLLPILRSITSKNIEKLTNKDFSF